MSKKIKLPLPIKLYNIAIAPRFANRINNYIYRSKIQNNHISLEAEFRGIGKNYFDTAKLLNINYLIY